MSCFRDEEWFDDHDAEEPRLDPCWNTVWLIAMVWLLLLLAFALIIREILQDVDV